MVRAHFDGELATLHNQLHHLGELTVSSISSALTALAQQDCALAEQIAVNDQQINLAQRQVEERAITLIARQQPVARDLRAIINAISAGSELERIGDYAKAIARMVIGIPGCPPLQPPVELLNLGAAAQAMLVHALDALARNDAASAQTLAAEEDQVDRQYQQIRLLLAASLDGHAHPARVADLLAIAHYLERIADRATNLAERVIYGASARLVELNP